MSDIEKVNHQLNLIEQKAMAAKERFDDATLGDNSRRIPWEELPLYVREGWREVVLNHAELRRTTATEQVQNIATLVGTKYQIEMRNGCPTIVSVSKGEPIPEDEPVMLFRARDKHAVTLVRYYYQICSEDNCSDEHMQGIQARVEDFEEFCLYHPDRMKQPD